MRGDDLALPEPVADLPDDVRLMHSVLSNRKVGKQMVNVENCGTAMRFLTAFFACQPDMDVVIDGTDRMRKRPIGQLVDALRELDADIEYLGEQGFPPLHIKGKKLKQKEVFLSHPQSTQFVSALLLIDVKVDTDIRSPYIDMTRQILNGNYSEDSFEMCWSSAAFWYEAVALYGGEMLLEGLSLESIQGDRKVADIFRQLGVQTEVMNGGILISRSAEPMIEELALDFSTCPDLYPAVFATCVRLGIKMQFTGLESLPLKESNRLEAMRQMEEPDRHVCSSFADHRIAMALLVAGMEVDDTDCIRKSYPRFLEQWQRLHL